MIHSELGIQLAKQEHQKRNSQCDFQCIHSTDLPDKSYDAIVCSDVIEHVPDAEVLLHDIHRLLKNGGIAVLSTPIRFTEFPLDKEHFVEWFPSEWEMLFKSYNTLLFYQSHPVMFMEFMNFRILKILINLLSFFRNPFRLKKKFRYFALQYAVIKNEFRKYFNI